MFYLVEIADIYNPLRMSGLEVLESNNLDKCLYQYCLYNDNLVVDGIINNSYICGSLIHIQSGTSIAPILINILYQSKTLQDMYDYYSLYKAVCDL